MCASSDLDGDSLGCRHVQPTWPLLRVTGVRSCLWVLSAVPARAAHIPKHPTSDVVFNRVATGFYLAERFSKRKISCATPSSVTPVTLNLCVCVCVCACDTLCVCVCVCGLLFFDLVFPPLEFALLCSVFQ